ncbi:glycoside-pentoside-hexuronide (GPH):cation symporter [Limosilactobacillus reuteri]|uniref:glycoside-pentoside-hexuronide (GPH):cation symporter n=1 Tax=Limosilactobacillus reuteri TaxID=1598 RepID=UPI001959D30E|nr:glycoside-pentoside-hexuronide (GPH):cation symporter [Limosilactobacillus reuteri]MBM6813040.1 MFS transporter [Limosilactobacillus reuteri]
MTKKKGVMTVKEQLAYSFGAYGNDSFYSLLSGYLIVFITSHLFDSGNKALDAKMIGLVTAIIMILRIAELFIDPFIGNWIDRTKTRWGHSRPWIVAGGTVSTLLLAALFTPLGNLYQSNAMAYLVVFAIMYITMDIFYSFKDVGFWSLLSSLTTNSEEREKTATFARIGSAIGGSLVGVVVMPAVIFFSATKTSTGDTRGWMIFAAIICFLSLLSAWGVGIFNREVDSDIRHNEKDTVGVIGVFKAVAKNDQLLWVALAYLAYGIGNNITNSLIIYFFTYIVGKATAFSVLSTINIFAGMAATALFPILSKKFSRHQMFAGCLLVMVLGLGLFAFAGQSVALSLAAGIIYAFPQQMVFLIVLMIITDSVEYGQWKLGHRDESLSLSIRPLIDKFGGAVSNGVVGQIAIIAGMTTGATAASITATQRMNFKLLMLAVPAALMIIAIIIFLRKITLTEEKHAQIVDELERTWGENFKDEDDAADSQTEATTITAPVSGKLVALANVNDEHYAKGELGQGFAIKPSDGKVLAPFDGTVRLTFDDTRHAVGLVAENGMAVLIHVGLGTVKLKGTGFVSYVNRGQAVKRGDEILEFWQPTIQKAGLDDTVMVTVTNSDKFKEFKFIKTSGEVVDAGDEVLTVK